jgi:hypothetical protein
MAFAASLQLPLILFATPGGMEQVNRRFATLANQSGKTCEVVVIQGDHQSMVSPSVQRAIEWFRDETR